MQRIGIDMDEVLGDTLGHQLAWLKQHRQIDLRRETLKPGEKPHHRVSAADIKALEATMHQGDFFRHIPVMAHSQQVVAELVEDFEVFIVTAAMDFPKSCHAKIDWLGEHFPFIPPKHYVFCGDKRIFAADFLIDDSPHHFTHFGGQGILFDAPHNRTATEHERVHNWQQIAQRFKASST
jgi:5'-nucleotidase